MCVYLQENSSSEEHTLYVWDHFISRSHAKNIFVVAHSYGGLSFVELVSVYVVFLKIYTRTCAHSLKVRVDRVGKKIVQERND